MTQTIETYTNINFCVGLECIASMMRENVNPHKNVYKSMSHFYVCLLFCCCMSTVSVNITYLLCLLCLMWRFLMSFFVHHNTKKHLLIVSFLYTSFLWLVSCVWTLLEELCLSLVFLAHTHDIWYDILCVLCHRRCFIIPAMLLGLSIAGINIVKSDPYSTKAGAGMLRTSYALSSIYFDVLLRFHCSVVCSKAFRDLCCVPWVFSLFLPGFRSECLLINVCRQKSCFIVVI